MFLPNRMTKVKVVVFSKYLSALTEALGESGILHLVDAAAESRGKLLQNYDTGVDIRAIEKLLNRCETLLEALGVRQDLEAPHVNNLSQDEIADLFARIDREYREEADRVAKLLEEHTGLSHSDRMLADFPLQSMRLEALHNLSQLHIEIGTLGQEAFLRARAALSDDALFIQFPESNGQLLVVTNLKKKFAVDEMLDKFGFERIEVPDGLRRATVAEERQAINGRLQALSQEINSTKLSIVGLGEKHGGMLLAIRKQLRGLIAMRQAQGLFGQSRQLFCVAGWLPTENLPKLQKLVDQATENTGVIEATDADDVPDGAANDQIPVQLSENGFTRPFRMLVTNFGIPNYRELDPSLFVGITFMIMFGYMFGDVGQGAVLALAGLLFRCRKSSSPAMKDVGTLLLCCGGSSILFGFLYGSIFGMEDLLPHLWLSPMHDIPRLLITAVGVGVVFLSVSLIINIINHIRIRKFYKGTFDKYGILGLAFYWACLGVGINVMVTKEFKPWQIALVLTPLVLIFLSGPIHHFLHKPQAGEEKEGLFNVVLEGVVETLETLTGYLSGTVSFVRVGALAISHAALCLAISNIMNLTGSGIGGTLGKILIAIAGNALVICFEGMVAAIQCVRLEYYEMFSRYFKGDGIPYQPFQFKTDNSGQN
ncbi:MAG: hypothetical protein J6Y80_04380 [Victivallales bacterium]|nr:hypothetical protein [Victivallales bacterium]